MLAVLIAAPASLAVTYWLLRWAYMQGYEDGIREAVKAIREHSLQDRLKDPDNAR